MHFFARLILAALGLALSLPAAAQNPVIYGSQIAAPNTVVCDGSTDTTSALQNAENSRQAMPGGILLLPAGVCVVSGTITVKGPGKWVGAGSQAFTTSNGTIIRDNRTTGDTIAVVSHDGMGFEDFRIDVASFKTSGAGISLGTPGTTLAANAASGAPSVTVANAAIFTVGDQIEISLNSTGNNSTFTTAVTAVNTGTGVVTLAQTLTGAANSGNAVWDGYNQRSDLTRVVIRGTYDGLRIDCADYVTVTKSAFTDYADDGIKKINQCYPDAGGDAYTDNTFWDQNRGTSRAGFEFLAGGDIALTGNKFLASAYGFLVNATYGPTGTARLTGNSIEEQKTARIGAIQAVSGVEYGNLVITGNQFSNIANQPSQGLFYIGAGTPTSAPKWIRNIAFVGNVSNDAVTTALPSIVVLDGDGISVAANVLNNNGTAGPTAISVAGAATHATIAANQIIGYPSGNYGAISGAVSVLDSSTAGTVQRQPTDRSRY